MSVSTIKHGAGLGEQRRQVQTNRLAGERTAAYRLHVWRRDTDRDLGFPDARQDINLTVRRKYLHPHGARHLTTERFKSCARDQNSAPFVPIDIYSTRLLFR